MPEQNNNKEDLEQKNIKKEGFFKKVIKSIKDVDGNDIDAARHPKQIIKIPCDKKMPVNAIMRVNFLDWQNQKNIVSL